MRAILNTSEEEQSVDPDAPRQLNRPTSYINVALKSRLLAPFIKVFLMFQVNLSADQLKLIGSTLVRAIQQENRDAYLYGKVHQTGSKPAESTELTRVYNALAYEVDNADVISGNYGLGCYSKTAHKDVHQAYCIAKSLIRNYVSNKGSLTTYKYKDVDPDDTYVISKEPNGLPPVASYRIAKHIYESVMSLTPWIAFSIVKEAAIELGYNVTRFKPNRNLDQ